MSPEGFGDNHSLINRNFPIKFQRVKYPFSYKGFITFIASFLLWVLDTHKQEVFFPLLFSIGMIRLLAGM